MVHASDERGLLINSCNKIRVSYQRDLVVGLCESTIDIITLDKACIARPGLCADRNTYGDDVIVGRKLLYNGYLLLKLRKFRGQLS